MARSIEHRTTFSADAKTVHDALVDKQFINAKLAKLGGPHAQLTEHRVDAAATRIHTKHGIPAQKLPGPVRALLGGDLTIVRTEEWRADGDGYRGEISVTVPNAPGALTGTSRITGAQGSSTQELRGEIKVSIPVVGSKVEESVSGHIIKLLDNEAAFLAEWLGSGE
ncbi:DUF2505 domain-containing protein [Sciscionella marina]|uniref:DUF2505 domain-containing protein n=1 Tax=Sciscionella marina TaxID=508770 RepID=UPI00035E2A7E|nr:DUF2505 domain-containing protein [Sciscionella marina]